MRLTVASSAILEIVGLRILKANLQRPGPDVLLHERCTNAETCCDSITALTCGLTARCAPAENDTHTSMAWGFGTLG